MLEDMEGSDELVSDINSFSLVAVEVTARVTNSRVTAKQLIKDVEELDLSLCAVRKPHDIQEQRC
jgi:hypothetical protein